MSSGDDARERDVIPRLPPPPRPHLRGTGTAAQNRILASEVRVWKRLVELLVALKQLEKGTLREEEIDRAAEEAQKAGAGSRLFPVAWDQASPDLRRAVKVLEQAVRRADQEGRGCVPKSRERGFCVHLSNHTAASWRRGGPTSPVGERWSR
jgi:hypothetical protein